MVPPGACGLSVQLGGTMAAERKIFYVKSNICNQDKINCWLYNRRICRGKGM